MPSREEIHSTLDKMIISASGWRGVFAVNGDEESNAGQISEAHRIICAAAALVFSEYLKNEYNNGSPLIFLGSDTRPTGKAAADAMIPALLAGGCDVRYAGIVAAPEIMAWARCEDLRGTNSAAGFIYISASHNPIGYNGIKFGLTSGGVLAPEEMNKLIAGFRAFLDGNDCVTKTETIVSAAGTEQKKRVYSCLESCKSEARKAYFDFCNVVAWDGNFGIASLLKDSLKKNSLGIVCDFNGSARTVSADRDFFASLGLKFEYINGAPGEIVHRIVPEGTALEPCRELLERTHRRDASFMLGYVPDCDGDRGNLVIWDDAAGSSRVLEAQEVFALACVAEFSHLVWSGAGISRAAVAVNDPTSMRIDRIAEAFGIRVFRAEVGEANVVSLARSLREKGFLVRILGEGSAGGNITHPSAVRDPINTVLAIVKLLVLRTSSEKPGLFEIWCERSGQAEKYRSNFTIADIISSLPQFASTPSYSDEALLRINTKDHTLLKDRYEKVFLREWEEQKDELKTRYGFCRWEAIAYNGQTENRALGSFGEAGRGGLKILFLNSEGRESACIWMRGSATEPVFRIMADAEGVGKAPAGEIEKFLIDWQRRMILLADKE